MSALLRCVLVLPALAACLQPVSLGTDDAGPPPELLTLTGNLCVPPTDPASFPTKVVFVVEQSEAMCLFDPPGSTQNNAACEAALLSYAGQGGLISPEPSRVSALKRELTKAQQASTQVALVAASDILTTWPLSVGGPPPFAPMSDPGFLASAMSRVSQFQSELGGQTDYQLALEIAVAAVEADVLKTELTSPETLPRSRYVVVLIGSGLPGVRCSADDALPAYATAASPQLPFADSSTECATTFRGMDRNQPYQLEAVAGRLRALKERYRIADVRLDTVQLHTSELLTSCGQQCIDMLGPLPGIPAGQVAAAVAQLSARLMSRLATAGGGSTVSVSSVAAQKELEAIPFDFSSKASPTVLKTLLLEQLNATPGLMGNRVDGDGDGLADEDETGREHATDFDGDCFSDAFETQWATYGFDPAERDPRGCDPLSPQTVNCICRDSDGDGLSQFEEDYLGTRQTLVDTDGDGAPDGLEVVNGLDPRKPNAVRDLDGDGVPDLQELREGSNPLVEDPAYRQDYRLEYRITETAQRADGARCYDYTISNVRLVTPRSVSNRADGFNLFRIWVAGAPESVNSTDFGVWQTACAWAQYVPSSLLVPPGGRLAVPPVHFGAPQRLTGDPKGAWDAFCAGSKP